MSSFVIGVDVGGTNTDAVILKHREIISSFKHPTTPDPIHGIINAIKGCLSHCKDGPELVKANLKRVCIGTTHFVNAVIERNRDNLVPVAVIRLCGPASLAIPPFADYPNDLKSLIKSKVYMVSGGLEYNGKNISTLKQDQIKDIARELLCTKPSAIKHVVISGIFSPLDDPSKNQEKIAADTLLSISNEFSITQASRITARLGILERENAAILNESLKSFAVKTITAFHKALKDLELDCPLYLTQNDGTLIDVDEAMKNPILTFSSGPTNSMRGAVFLSGRTDALVIDIGGTTTDIGMVCNGFPREASSQVKIGGVRTNFQMPDVLSLYLGGGSKVIVNSKDPHSSVVVGPESVGCHLTIKAQCFGGDVLTATDIAVTAGIAKLKDASISSINATCTVTYNVMKQIRNKIETLIDKIKIERKDVPVILVGGGAILIDIGLSLRGASCVIVPPYFMVANAVGAALGSVAGRSERIENVSEVMESLKSKYTDLSEDELRNKATESLIEKGIKIATEVARKKGCVLGSERLQERKVMPIHTDAVKVSIKVIGKLSDELEINNQSEHVKTKIENTILLNKDTSIIIKDNPFWPFSSVADKQRDELAGLPQPLINSETGEWVLSVCDIECISIGAGILGCGGGGDPHVGQTIALLLQEQGKEIKIMNPWRVDKSMFGLAAPVALMGAPAVVGEKLVNGNESKMCLNVVQNIIATGVCEESCDYGRKETEGIILTTRDMSSGNKIWLPDISSLPNIGINNDKIPLNRRISGLICVEIGGMNSFEPMVTAAKVGLPLLDADGMGRAFPELQMFLPYINGVKAYPSCVVNEKGDVVAVTHVNNAMDLEEFFRIECVRMGMLCGICLTPMSLEDVLSNCVLLSYSQAWQLGRVILRARAIGGMSIVDAVAEQQKGTILLIGKITDVYRDTSEGFTKSTVTVEGLGKYSGEVISIIAKNENLIARKMNTDGTKGDVLAVTPDLITIIDSDSGYPITTNNVNYGLRVAVLALPAYHGFTTTQSLLFVGPKAFGFDDVEYWTK